MTYYFRDVERFHEKFQLAPNPTFTLPQDLHDFRVLFLKEEFQEYVDSCKVDDLATAIDSLVDLVYIVCGTAILHGITQERWDEMVASRLFEDGPFSPARHLDFDEPYHSRVQFLSAEVNVVFTASMAAMIENYQASYVNADQTAAWSSLADLYLICLSGATAMGITDKIWQEFWDDVQRANMSKERVLRAEDSKRGSTWDVRKPTGWIAPDSEGILRKYA